METIATPIPRDAPPIFPIANSVFIAIEFSRCTDYAVAVVGISLGCALVEDSGQCVEKLLSRVGDRGG